MSDTRYLSDQSSDQLEKVAQSSTETLSFFVQNFCDQLKNLPSHIQNLQENEPDFFACQREVREKAEKLLTDFNHQRDDLLQKFDPRLLFAAKEVLEDLSKEGNALKQDLEESLKDKSCILNQNWELCTQKWMDFQSNWINKKNLIDRILKLLSERTSSLIDKDLKIIHDYQKQSLSQLSTSPETKNLEERLDKAIKVPLKMLHDLKNTPEQLSVEQAPEWLDNVYQKRETYFDNLLMKIDIVMKDVVHPHEIRDVNQLSEVEHEIAFMENELHSINQFLNNKTLGKNELEQRLEHVLDHLNHLQIPSLPLDLQEKMERIEETILIFLLRVKLV